jgi:hypothetical protein
MLQSPVRLQTTWQEMDGCSEAGAPRYASVSESRICEAFSVRLSTPSCAVRIACNLRGFSGTVKAGRPAGHGVYTTLFWMHASHPPCPTLSHAAILAP